jgi:hypothetical protein
MSQLGGIGKCGADVIGTQRRIATQYLLLRSALSQTVQNHSDWDSSARSTNCATANLGIAAQKLFPCRHVPSIAPHRRETRSSR